jgi:hypothetical protein
MEANQRAGHLVVLAAEREQAVVPVAHADKGPAAPAQAALAQGAGVGAEALFQREDGFEPVTEVFAAAEAEPVALAHTVVQLGEMRSADVADACHTLVDQAVDRDLGVLRQRRADAEQCSQPECCFLHGRLLLTNRERWRRMKSLRQHCPLSLH